MSKLGPRLPLIVLVDGIRTYANASVRRLVETLCASVAADENVAVTFRDLEAEPITSELDGLLLNLSRRPTDMFAKSLGRKSTVLEVLVQDGRESVATLQQCEARSHYRIGSFAIAEHPSLLRISPRQYTPSGGHNLGSWFGRSHVKSRSHLEAQLLRGMYHPFSLLFAFLRTGRELTAFSQYVPDQPAASGIDRGRVLQTNLAYTPTWLIRTVRNLRNRKAWTQWNIGTVKVGFGGGLGSKRKWAPPCSSGFIADPFPLVHHNQAFVFFEETEHRSGKGFISVAPMDVDGTIQMDQRRAVLRMPFHLSFPFVFVHEGTAYMLPEQAESMELVLYRADDSLMTWTRQRVLLEKVELADPVLFSHDQRWYLFVSEASNGNHDNNLLLFVADDLDGEFSLHPSSPIRLSLYGSRMAGAIREVDGRLFRYGQDCSSHYGERVVEFAVTELTPDVYSEIVVRELNLPEDDLHNHAFHTFNVVGETAVIDGGRLTLKAR
jgi:hypothetical protein